MNNFNGSTYRDDKVIINCRRCSQKLRVPRNAGKLSVTCPVCKTQFIFNPNDIIFKTTSYFRNAAEAIKKSMPRLSVYKRTFYNMWKSITNRYKR